MENPNEKAAHIERTFHHAFKSVCNLSIDANLLPSDIENLHILHAVFYKFWLLIEFNKSLKSKFISEFIANIDNKKEKELIFNYQRKLHLLYDIHKMVYTIGPIK